MTKPANGPQKKQNDDERDGRQKAPHPGGPPPGAGNH
jgi:hypothetical protein